MPITAQIPLLTTGLNGLVGSKLKSLYQEKYAFTNLDVTDPTQPIDITNESMVLEAFNNSPATTVVHFAAFTDVTAAWQQRDDKNSVSYKVNVLGTQNIVKAAAQTGKHLIHISTAYVFDGKKFADDQNTQPIPYIETDQPHPIEWYGQTKFEAEQAVQESSSPWTILRIDQPFRSDSFPKVDVAHRILKGLTDESLLPPFTNHWFGPTFVDDFAQVIDWVIRTKATGLFHATAGEAWTDYDFAQTIRDIFQFGTSIRPGNLDEYLKTTQRPYQRNTALNCQKLTSALDFKLKTIREALQIMKKIVDGTGL